MTNVNECDIIRVGKNCKGEIIMNKRGRHGDTIMCCNDGVIHPSKSAASNYYKISASAITRQLNGERKTAAGLYFIRVTGNESKVELEKIREQKLRMCYRLKEAIVE